MAYWTVHALALQFTGIAMLPNCGRCYDLCCQLDDKEALHSARVQYGIAKGHQFMSNFSSVVNKPSDRSSLQKLVAWKDVRITPSSCEASDSDCSGDKEDCTAKEQECLEQEKPETED